MTARERIEILLDEGTFEEWDMFVEHRCSEFDMEKQKIPGDGVVTGYGTINEDLHLCSAKISQFLEDHCLNHTPKRFQRLWIRLCKLVLQLSGLTILEEQEFKKGVASLAGYAEVFQRNVLSSGVIPQISVIMGPCAGGAVYSPAMTDFIFMIKDTSYMFVTGPDVLKQ